MKRIGIVALALVLLLLYIPAFAQSTGTVRRSANVRSGPGTNFAIVGGAKPGQVVTILGSNAAGDWYQIGQGRWIAAFLVSGVGQSPEEVVPTKALSAAESKAASPIQAYTDELSSIMTSYSTALAVLGTQITKAHTDAKVLQDEDWQLTTVAALAYVQRLGERVRAVTPPPSLQQVHNDTELAAIHYDTATEIVTKGVEQMDVNLLAAAIDEMTLGNKAIRSAQAKLEALAQATSAPVSTMTPAKEP
jgi:uncharacterized protein YgiM (DUF1202 family)